MCDRSVTSQTCLSEGFEHLRRYAPSHQYRKERPQFFEVRVALDSRVAIQRIIESAWMRKVQRVVTKGIQCICTKSAVPVKRCWFLTHAEMRSLSSPLGWELRRLQHRITFPPMGRAYLSNMSVPP